MLGRERISKRKFSINGGCKMIMHNAYKCKECNSIIHHPVKMLLNTPARCRCGSIDLKYLGKKMKEETK